MWGERAEEERGAEVGHEMAEESTEPGVGLAEGLPHPPLQNGAFDSEQDRKPVLAKQEH